MLVPSGSLLTFHCPTSPPSTFGSWMVRTSTCFAPFVGFGGGKEGTRGMRKVWVEVVTDHTPNSWLVPGRLHLNERKPHSSPELVQILQEIPQVKVCGSMCLLGCNFHPSGIRTSSFSLRSSGTVHRMTRLRPSAGPEAVVVGRGRRTTVASMTVIGFSRGI